MKKRQVCVVMIVCKEDGTWYKDYEFVNTFYPNNPTIGQDALLKFSEKIEEREDEYVGVFDIRVAEPQQDMKESCQNDDVTCPECKYFKDCFQNLTEN